MPEDIEIERESIQVKPPKSISRSDNFGTLSADYAKVTIAQNTQMCTFTFFQTHPIAKHDARGIVLDSLEDEMVLEVKMPFSTSFALAMYMMSVLKQIQSKPEPTRTDFGPVSIKTVKKPTDEKHI